MLRVITIVMYFLWAVAILAVLATTLTDFKYEDLNMIAGLAFVFAGLNSYFAYTMRKSSSR